MILKPRYSNGKSTTLSILGTARIVSVTRFQRFNEFPNQRGAHPTVCTTADACSAANVKLTNTRRLADRSDRFFIQPTTGEYVYLRSRRSLIAREPGNLLLPVAAATTC